MTKRNRTDRRQSTVNVELPSKQHVQFVQDALTITNHYRLAQKLNIINMETFCANAVLTGAKEVHEFYRKQQEAQANAQEASNNVDTSDNSAGRVSGAVDTSASSDSEDSASLSEGTNG